MFAPAYFTRAYFPSPYYFPSTTMYVWRQRGTDIVVGRTFRNAKAIRSSSHVRVGRTTDQVVVSRSRRHVRVIRTFKNAKG